MKHDLDVSSGDGQDLVRGFTVVAATTEVEQKHIDSLKALGVEEDDLPTLAATTPGGFTAAHVTALEDAKADDCWEVLNCNDFNRDDLTITFGEPSRSPNVGEAVHYWSARLPVHADQPTPDLDDPEGDGVKIADRGASGEYNLWLSNYGVFDEGNVLTDGENNKLADQGTAADDDEHRYLSYAAYGLFVYWDYTTHDDQIVPGRWQAFHFGYDAFDELPDEAISGEFKGTTIGHIVHPAATGSKGMGDLTRVRGDVMLKATIGGEGATANKISGSIENLQAAQGLGWYNFAPLSEGVELKLGGIEAGGAYSGEAITADATDTENWDTGTYGGTFYGPVTGLETGGHWMLPAMGDNRDVFLAVGGAFGAVCTKGCAAE